jgi:hypothetical protein
VGPRDDVSLQQPADGACVDEDVCVLLADPEFRSNCEQRPRLEFMEATLVRRAQALIRNRHVSPVEVALASAFADQHPDLCLPTDDRDGAGC